MGEPGHKRHRVFVEDARGNGSYLRATWHPERRLFTISTWTGEVCTGAVRLPAAQASEVVGLMVDGLAELATPVDARPGLGAAPAPRRPAGSTGRPAGSPGSPGAFGDARRGGSPLDGIRRWLRNRKAVVAPAVPLRPQPPKDAPTPTDERTG
jgi:hypothetical protein